MREREKDSTVFVGKKPAMSYVLPVVTQLSEGQPVRIIGRGKAISKAVDIAEIVRNRFVKDAVVRTIRIGTEEIEGELKEKVNISFIELLLSR